MKSQLKMLNTKKRLEKNSGIIIIVVLWILVILTLLSVGIGQRTRMELSLTRHSVGQFKSKYLAWAGLVYSMKYIESDTKSEETRQNDTLYQCAVDLKGANLDKVFKEVELPGGSFTISYLDDENSENTEEYFGFQDEEKRININATTPQNYKVLSSLIVTQGFESSEANIIAASVIDWRDENDKIELGDDGAENNYYSNLEKSYNCKNRPFDSVDELLLVRGVTDEIFKKIKNHITIYPKEGALLINFDTASETVLRAIAISSNNPSPEDVDSLLKKIMAHRQGDDQRTATADDNVVETSKMGLNQAEQAIFLNMQNYRTKVSNFLRVRVRGSEANSSSYFDIEEVIARN